jgi:hypothetical protein
MRQSANNGSPEQKPRKEQTMAVQAKHHGGKVKGAAPGDAPNTGAPGPTPAPTRPAAPDVISRPRQATPAGYGMNSDAGPVSLAPGVTRQSPLADNLRASVDDDGVLDHVQQFGTARRDDSITGQLRKIADGNVPTSYGMKDANTGGAPRGTIPSTLGATNAQPVRKP